MSAATHAIVQPRFRNILFLTDFSPCSELASPFARAIAMRNGSTIHAVHIVSRGPVVIGGEFGGAGIELETESEDTACLRMGHFLQSGAFDGVLYTQTVQTGVLKEVLTELTTGLNIDLIVLGTHGRRGMHHLLLGSVADQVFRRATCPVLTVGPNIRDHGLSSGNVHTILYATDFSPGSLHALEYGIYLARTYKAQITLLHAMKDDASAPLYRKRATEQVEQRLSGLVAGAGVDFKVVVGHRPPVEMILTTSRDSSADIIVMGAHRGRSASAHAPWAVVDRVVCYAPCPVLTVGTSSP